VNGPASQELQAVPGAAGAASPAAAGPEPRPERAPLGRTELLLILGFWTLIAVLNSANSLANSLLEPRTGPWQRVMPLSPVLLAFGTAYIWALLTPPIFKLTSRYNERSGWRYHVMFVVVGLVVAIAVDMATSYLRSVLYYAPAPLTPELQVVARLRRLWFMNEFIVYVAVLAAGFARNYFLRYRSRREEAINLQAQAAQLQTPDFQGALVQAVTDAVIRFRDSIEGGPR